MSGPDDIKKALKDSGLIIPPNLGTAQEEEEAESIFCKIACEWGYCFITACDTGHCWLLCSGPCTVTDCRQGGPFDSGIVEGGESSQTI